MQGRGWGGGEGGPRGRTRAPSRTPALQVPLFHNCSSKLCAGLILSLEARVYVPQDVVFARGEWGDEMMSAYACIDPGGNGLLLTQTLVDRATLPQSSTKER